MTRAATLRRTRELLARHERWPSATTMWAAQQHEHGWRRAGDNGLVALNEKPRLLHTSSMKRSALIVEFATLKRSFHSLEGASAPVLFVRLLLLVVQALMADGAVAPVDARMRVQDVWSGATTREPRRESQLTYPVGNSCGICGYMYMDRCCVLLLLSGAMHGVSCSVALLLSPRLAPCPRDMASLPGIL